VSFIRSGTSEAATPHVHVWKDEPLGHGTRSCDCGQVIPRETGVDDETEAYLQAAEEGFRNGCEAAARALVEEAQQEKSLAAEHEARAVVLLRAAEHARLIGKGRG
jgi:hypothetical protein